MNEKQKEILQEQKALLGGKVLFRIGIGLIFLMIGVASMNIYLGLIGIILLSINNKATKEINDINFKLEEK